MEIKKRVAPNVFSTIILNEFITVNTYGKKIREGEGKKGLEEEEGERRGDEEKQE